jgi:hypothetical protein
MIEIAELETLTIIDLESKIENAFNTVNLGFFYICICFGLIRKKYDDLGALYQDNNYLEYRNLIKKSKEIIDENIELSEKYKNQAEIIKNKNKSTFDEIEIKEKSFRKELKTTSFPHTFNKYIDHLHSKINNLPEKTSLYEYSELGLYILQYPAFFKKLSTEINIDNYRKKLLLFEEMTGYYKQINSSTLKSYITDIKELSYADLKMKYNIISSHQSSPVITRTNKEGLWIGEEQLLSEMDIETIAKDKTKIDKLRKFIKLLLKS